MLHCSLHIMVGMAITIFTFIVHKIVSAGKSSNILSFTVYIIQCCAHTASITNGTVNYGA
jgi:hypothetical protein